MKSTRTGNQYRLVRFVFAIECVVTRDYSMLKRVASHTISHWLALTVPLLASTGATAGLSRSVSSDSRTADHSHC